ncbi:DUF2298 domain-containing protein [Ktedonospora formicarum]|uniref:Chlor_Arch_YYY domain-containing protein n=1 Tax=Ktedonospora formicarum TaxID=2778364 RepID=A0A8J3HY44_9CHLR|nr:DUF2298 domain-containing protein [Ktedonospora formicarum]GHO43118.1 hypothetical protein KSX_12810 [Ktedonospora formicarum]
MLELFQMWALVEAIGIISLPLTITVFRNLPDRGWAFSKSLGVIVFVFCVWLPLMWLRFLPYTQLFLLGIACILLALSLPGWLWKRRDIWKLMRLNIPYILATEVVFLSMVLLLGWIRSFGPEIRGWEMFMDEGFLSSIMRSAHLPPSDMWYAGSAINYYYYAHFFIATLAKLLGQPSYVAFNTGICLLFGLTGISFFGVTCNIVSWTRYLRQRSKEGLASEVVPSTAYPSLTGSILFGLLAIFMALLMGNLASTQIWWQNHGMVTTTADQAYIFWVGPSRVISKTINEFPAFSFLLSCFHAHVLSFAFTVLALGVAFNLLLEPAGKGLNVFGEGWRLGLTLFCTALILGGLYLMNGWDYPTYLGLCLVCIVFQQCLAYQLRFQWALLLDIFVAAVTLIALSFLLYLPFFLTFVSPAQGLGLVAPQDRSSLTNELLIYGIFAFVVISFLVVSALKRPLLDLTIRRDPDGSLHQLQFSVRLTWVLVVAVFCLGLLVLVFVRNSTTLLIAGGVAVAAFVLALYHLGDRAHAYALLLGGLAFLLIAGCEVFFLRDVFADQDPRMNTVFKFYFQAWALLSIASSVGLSFLVASLRPVKLNVVTVHWLQRFGIGLWYLLLLIFMLAGAVYPLQAPYARYGPGNVPIASKALSSTGSLNGLNYLKNDPLYPGDYAAILWLNEHVQDNPGIIEAVGGDYTEYGRISIFTGLSSPINWPGHEVQWRVALLHNPVNAEDFNQRQTAVDLVYQDPDKNMVLQNMKRYRVEYLYVGPLEYKKYPSANLHRFAAFMQIVYNANGVTIYKIKS